MKSQSQSVKVTMTIQYALTNNSEKMKMKKKTKKKENTNYANSGPEHTVCVKKHCDEYSNNVVIWPKINGNHNAKSNKYSKTLNHSHSFTAEDSSKSDTLSIPSIECYVNGYT